MESLREKKAKEAYLNFLHAKGASSGTLYKKSLFLDHLTCGLVGKPLGRQEYALALHVALKEKSKDEKYAYQNTAREFFPFWMNDIKAIAAFNAHYGFDVQSIKWKPLAQTLKKLTESLDNEFFDNHENLALARYAQSLKQRGADNLVIDTRLKLAKIVLVRLRDAPVRNNITYRMAVDLVLPLFKVKDIRQLFLTVVREFYHVWIDTLYPNKKPSAPKHLNAQAPQHPAIPQTSIVNQQSMKS